MEVDDGPNNLELSEREEEDEDHEQQQQEVRMQAENDEKVCMWAEEEEERGCMAQSDTAQAPDSRNEVAGSSPANRQGGV